MQAICCSCIALALVLSILTPVIMIFLFLCVSGHPFREDSGHGYVCSCSIPIPSSRPTLGWKDRVQRFLLRDRTLGYLFLLPASWSSLAW